MTRTILIHLNVEVPATESRTADELADTIVAQIQIASAEVICSLAEEI